MEIESLTWKKILILMELGGCSKLIIININSKRITKIAQLYVSDLSVEE